MVAIYTALNRFFSFMLTFYSQFVAILLFLAMDPHHHHNQLPNLTKPNFSILKGVACAPICPISSFFQQILIDAATTNLYDQKYICSFVILAVICTGLSVCTLCVFYALKSGEEG